jgi:hypothetical protein
MAVEDEPVAEPTIHEIIQRSGRKIAIGSDWLNVVDAGHAPKFVDVISEARLHAGIVYLSLASGVIEGNEAFCQVESRLRMNIVTAQNLHRLLGQMIEDHFKPVDKSTTN